MSKLPENCETPEELRRIRENRVTDAIHLRMPDRVPVCTTIGYFAAKYAGIPCSAAYYDYDAWFEAYRKTLQDFPADMIFPQPFRPGRVLEILNPRTIRWPGYNSDPRYGHQAIEIDNMKADEYEAFLSDPSDYIFRTIVSRTSENMTGFARLPKLGDLESGAIALNILAETFSNPEVAHSFETLIEAGREINKWKEKTMKFDQMISDMGFPPFFHTFAMPSFDIISNGMRGLNGTIMDMYRQPDKIMAACEKVLELTLERPLPPPNENGNIRIFMTNTRGSDEFLSKEQFDRFYWPTFKKLVNTLVERGGTPCIFFEGSFTSRLEYLLEFPKGKVLARFDKTDIFRAKDVLKGHLCIEGNVPSSLLQMGTVDDVKEHCKKLIDYCGKDGGYILSPRSSTDEVKPENLKAMIEFTKDYGVY
ncbi:uroporphyrinogen decarboxylase family protein [Thermodesulfobacteriota bacterium]